MEQVTEEKPTKRRARSSKSADNGCLKKIDAETAKQLKQIKDKANKKQFGRNVRDSEVLSMAVGMITDAEIKLLQEATYSEKDRLLIAHSEYISQNGKITLDDFIGKLLRGEISQTFN
jgi:predicted DNA-binding protein with PD1-like motif